MSEFKGTPGPWSCEYDGDGMRFNEISVYVDDCYEEYRKDALLISKAPEMLEMLNRLVEWYGKREDHPDKMIAEEILCVGKNQDELISEAMNLIKQATEL